MPSNNINSKNKNKQSLKSRIAALLKKVHAIDVPVLGEIYIKPMSIHGALHVGAMDDQAQQSAALMIDCVCDASGTRIFTADDHQTLLDLPHEVAIEIVENIHAISETGATSQGK